MLSPSPSLCIHRREEVNTSPPKDVTDLPSPGSIWHAGKSGTYSFYTGNDLIQLRT